MSDERIIFKDKHVKIYENPDGFHVYFYHKMTRERMIEFLEFSKLKLEDDRGR